jgi:hypothetical protein
VQTDFIDMKEQMRDDFISLFSCLNRLWQKPLREAQGLLSGANDELLEKQCGLRLVGDPPNVILDQRQPNTAAATFTAAPALPTGSGHGIIPAVPMCHVPAARSLRSSETQRSASDPALLFAKIFEKNEFKSRITLQYTAGTWVGANIRVSHSEAIVNGHSYPIQWGIPLRAVISEGDTVLPQSNLEEAAVRVSIT